MIFPLYLDGKEIFHASQILSSKDTLSLRGYLTAGILSKWLSTHGGESYARELSKYDILWQDNGDIINKVFFSDTLEIRRKNFFICDNSYVISTGKGSSFYNFIGSNNSSFITDSGSKSLSSFSSFLPYEYYSISNKNKKFLVKTGSGIQILSITEFFDNFPLNRYGYGMHLI